MELEKAPLVTGEGETKPESLLHTGFWGIFKSSFGWVPVRYVYRYNAGDVKHTGTFLTLTRKLQSGVSITYIPPGFGLSLPISEITEFLNQLGSGLKKHLPKTTVSIRIDLPWQLQQEESIFSVSRQAESAGYRKAAGDVQPPDTVIIDLTRPEEEILSAMKKKTRYNIRLAARKGIKVKSGGSERLKEWYSLYRETARRDRIALHSFAYYEKLFILAESGDIADAPLLRLYTAHHDGDFLAGNVVTFFSDTATYLYGASSSEKRNLMPPYALQWEAIRKAKLNNCKVYDLFGIPPADDPNHPMHGLYRFKTGFGGRLVHRAGAWDFVCRRGAYSAYRSAEIARTWYYKSFRKKLVR